jgi:nucleotide-binding universal stress UspA family protein
MKVKTILVPLDGSANSLKSLKYALDLAAQLGAEVVGLHVVTDMSLFTAVHPIVIAENKWPTYVRDLVKDAQKIASKSKVGYHEIVIGGKSAGYDIVTFANSKSNSIDVVVIGHRGLGYPKEIIPGSTANFIIHKSQVPVLLVA